MLQRSSWSGLILSAAVISVAWGPGMAVAQDAGAAAPAATQPGGTMVQTEAGAKSLQSLADDYMHYSLVNNVELAQANGQAILAANPDPADLLAAFEAAANGRVPRDIMIEDQKRTELREVSTRLLNLLEAGHRAVARDPVRIRAEIERLGNGPRAYNNAKERLTAAGPYAAPIFLEYLQNADKKNLQPFIIQLMVEIGRPLVLPLTEALQSKDNGLRVQLVQVIGQIGYPQALPRLRELQAESNIPDELKRVVDQAISRIDRTGGAAKSSPAELYLAAARAYYAKRASYQPPMPDEKTNPIWVFDTGLNNVAQIEVPTPIWNSVMTMRDSEDALKLESNNAGAISLWLAASMRREINLPKGAKDPMLSPGTPDPSFYALAAGPVYVNPVLGQALADHDAALALKAIDALEATGGTQGLVADGGASPLVRALSYPDRAVRFRAAFALARANPAKPFADSFRVVPVLAEAISSAGSPTALVVGADEDVRNHLADILRNGSSHYTVYTGPTLAAALQQSRRAPAFDVIVIENGPEVAKISQLGQQDYRLPGAPVLVAASEDNLPGVKAEVEENRGYGAISNKADEAALTAALATAQADSGTVPFDAQTAAQMASTSIKLLDTLSADHASIYKVQDALPTLTDALRDKRPDIATGAAGVLGHLNNPDAEKAIAAIALAPDTDASLRTPMLMALAESAKRTGDALDSSAVNALIKEVSTESDPQIKMAAATALGALNVPSNQASTLILQQIK